MRRRWLSSINVRHQFKRLLRKTQPISRVVVHFTLEPLYVHFSLVYWCRWDGKHNQRALLIVRIVTELIAFIWIIVVQFADLCRFVYSLNTRSISLINSNIFKLFRPGIYFCALGENYFNYSSYFECLCIILASFEW